MMNNLLKWRKTIAFVVALAAIVYLCPRPADLETLKWLAGAIAAMAAALFVGQGLKKAAP